VLRKTVVVSRATDSLAAARTVAREMQSIG